MSDLKNDRRPILDPLLLALKSRRVLIALVTLMVGVIALAVPELTAVRGELLTLLITLALALIGGYSLEDAARAARDGASTPTNANLQELVKRVLNEWIDEAAEHRKLPEEARDVRAGL